LPSHLLDCDSPGAGVEGMGVGLELQSWREHAKQFLLNHIQFVNRSGIDADADENYLRDEL